VTANWMRGRVDNVRRTVDSEAVPFLHGRSVNVLFGMLRALEVRTCIQSRSIYNTHVKCHPRDCFILRDLGPLDEFQGQSLVVELHGEDGSWWCPGANHQMVQHLVGFGRHEGDQAAVFKLLGTKELASALCKTIHPHTKQPSTIFVLLLFTTRGRPITKTLWPTVPGAGASPRMAAHEELPPPATEEFWFTILDFVPLQRQ